MAASITPHTRLILEWSAYTYIVFFFSAPVLKVSSNKMQACVSNLRIESIQSSIVLKLLNLHFDSSISKSKSRETLSKESSTTPIFIELISSEEKTDPMIAVITRGASTTPTTNPFERSNTSIFFMTM